MAKGSSNKTKTSSTYRKPMTPPGGATRHRYEGGGKVKK